MHKPYRNALTEISPATIGSVRQDIVDDPGYVTRFMHQLTQSNPALALEILANAREASDRHNDPETAYISGAVHIVALVMKQARAAELVDLFNDEISAA